eukprot:2637034-Rhodomonas_salina.1
MGGCVGSARGGGGVHLSILASSVRCSTASWYAPNRFMNIACERMPSECQTEQNDDTDLSDEMQSSLPAPK